MKERGAQSFVDFLHQLDKLVSEHNANYTVFANNDKNEVIVLLPTGAIKITGSDVFFDVYIFSAVKEQEDVQATISRMLNAYVQLEGFFPHMFSDMYSENKTPGEVIVQLLTDEWGITNLEVINSGDVVFEYLGHTVDELFPTQLSREDVLKTVAVFDNPIVLLDESDNWLVFNSNGGFYYDSGKNALVNLNNIGGTLETAALTKILSRLDDKDFEYEVDLIDALNTLPARGSINYYENIVMAYALGVLV